MWLKTHLIKGLMTHNLRKVILKWIASGCISVTGLIFFLRILKGSFRLRLGAKQPISSLPVEQPPPRSEQYMLTLGNMQPTQGQAEKQFMLALLGIHYILTIYYNIMQMPNSNRHEIYSMEQCMSYLLGNIIQLEPSRFKLFNSTINKREPIIIISNSTEQSSSQSDGETVNVII